MIQSQLFELFDFSETLENLKIPSLLYSLYLENLWISSYHIKRKRKIAPNYAILCLGPKRIRDRQASETGTVA